ncbi:hypothetical protein B0T20DRAFT_43059 [Sordaria brevicollis]|uniref:RING-type domain-containing protein n=1 Tax=Sordaria brevicollis TaxID=83679 RepID=A0AAE0U9P5_SORBR|nr:hypothetical protein B0T20DRAFT_43059 [Sordaria brevicollis]
MDEMDYTMQAAVHPVPLQVPDWWMDTSQDRGQSRCPYRRGLAEGTGSGMQTGLGGFGDGNLGGITEGAGGAGGSQPNHRQSTTTTTTAAATITTATTTTTTSSHHQQSSLPYPPPFLPPASTLHRPILPPSHSSYPDNFLPYPHSSYYPLPPIQIPQIPPPSAHESSPSSFSRHPSDRSPPTSHSANRGYDPVHAASNSNNHNNNNDMNSRDRANQGSGRGDGGNADNNNNNNNMNNQGENRQTGPPATSHVHQYGNNENSNSNVNDGNVAAPTMGGNNTSVSGGIAVTFGTNPFSSNPGWSLPQNTQSWSSLPSPASNVQGQAQAPVTPFSGPLSGLSSMTGPGGPSGYSGSTLRPRPGIRSWVSASDPIPGGGADLDSFLDTVMGNTEEEQSGSGGGSGAGGSSSISTPTGAATGTGIGAPHQGHAGVGGGSGSRPTQGQFGWASLQGQNHPGAASFLPFPGPPLPPSNLPGEATYQYQYNRFPATSSHNPSAITPNIPHGQLPLPDRDSEPWGSRHTSHQPTEYYPSSGIILGHSLPGPLSWYTTPSSTGGGSNIIRLPVPDPRSRAPRFPPYRHSGMSNPIDGGNDSSLALPPPQGVQNSQAASSSTHRPSRQQRSGPGVTNAAAPPTSDNRPGTGSRTTSASASAPTSASASNRPTPTTSRSEMRAEMRDILVRTYRALDERSESPSEDESDVPEHVQRQQQLLDEERLTQFLRTRQQVFRGQSTKKVASKKAIESLEPVKVADLPETSRTCDICYNDYGTKSPEGITEQPLRIPKCKHIFGEHCIKKWFQDSNSCPYCRAELPTQQVYTQASAQSIREFLESGHFSRRHGGRAHQEFIRQMAQLSDSTPRHNGPRAWQAGGSGGPSPNLEPPGAPRRAHRHGSSHQRQTSSSGPSTQTSQRPRRERHASDGNESNRSANPVEMPSRPQPPPAASYTSEPASQWMQHDEASFHPGPANRDPALPDPFYGTGGPAQGQAPIPEQSGQPFASTYPGDSSFPGSANLPPSGPAR